MRIKKGLFVFFMSVLVLRSFAQVSVDPEEEFYADAVGWYLKGYIDSLPVLKPYPLNIVRTMLSAVAEVEDSSEAEKARGYSEKYFGKAWKVFLGAKSDIKLKQIEWGSNGKKPTYQNDGIFSGIVNFSSDVELGKKIGFGYSTNFLIENSGLEFSDVLPRYLTNSSQNKIKDFYFPTDKIEFMADMNGNMTFGDESMFGVIGFNKLGYGLYQNDSNVLNPTAYQSLNTSFNYIGKTVSYTHALMALGARNLKDKNVYSLGKFMAFHALRFSFLKNALSFSIFESAVFGNGFVPFYLMPTPFVVIANVSGFNDNVFFGTGVEWKLLPCVAFTADVYIDDTKLGKLIKLKPDESATRCAFKTGLIYTPLNSPCSMISLDYSLVTPYTYTFFTTQDSSYNLHDYTNYGINLGSNLPPNSDRVALRISFKPLKGLKIFSDTALIRHGNAYESLSDEEVISLFTGTDNIVSDGGIGMSTKGLDSALSRTGFLKQPNISYVVQAGLSSSYEFSFKNDIRLFFDAGYTFEYIRGDGVDSNIFSGPYSSVIDVQTARNAWVASLHDSYNHYFSLSAKILY